MEREIVPLVSVGKLRNMDIHMGHYRDKGEEIEYLQQAVQQLQKQLDESKKQIWQLNNESDEFRENSWQLEKELENSLEKTEKQNLFLKQMCSRMDRETDELKAKMKEVKRMNDLLNSDLLKYKHMETQWGNHIQQLEQKNDDLERAVRESRDCKSTVELHLDEALERDALRESKKEELMVKLQQLQEQNKDLAQEIKVRNMLSAFEKTASSSTENKVSIETQTEVAVKPLGNKVSRALHRTRELGRFFSCMSRDNASASS